MIRGDIKDNAGSVWAIVLMYGGARVTSECIDALLRQDYPSLTVLLVDNASPDGAGDEMRRAYPQIHHLDTGANLGYTGGNNRGIAYALERGAEYLLILNNDTVPEERCVSLLVDTAGSDLATAGAISPKILYYDDPARIAFAGGDFSAMRAIGRHRNAGQHDDPGEAARREEITFVTGACFLMPARVARAVGGFREEYFMYCEDVELSVRLRRAGYRLYYQPAARVLHREPIHGGIASATASFHRDRNRRRLAREYLTPMQRVIFALWFYPTRVVRFAQYVLRGDWSGARAIAAGAIRR